MKKSIYALFFIIFFCLIVNCFIQNNYCFANDYSLENITQKNAFRILKKISKDNKISITYIFPINSNILEELDFDEKETNLYKFYLMTCINSIAKSNQEKNSEIEIKSNIYFEDVDGFGFEMIMNQQNQDNSGVEKDNNISTYPQKTKLENNFFIEKFEYQIDFPFTKNIAESFVKVCETAIDLWTRDCKIESERSFLLKEQLKNSLFVYDFSSFENTIESNLMYQEGDFWHNVFIKNAQEIESCPQIVLYQKQINKGFCLIVCLVLTICVMICVSFVYKFGNVKCKKLNSN